MPAAAVAGAQRVDGADKEPVHDAEQHVRETVREVFGHDNLRPGQEEAVTAVLAGRDVLLVLPTGAGKSLAYQLPAVLVEGPTLVISPLLALQRDQVVHLEHGGRRTEARRVSSAETPRQRAAALAQAAAGEIEFLFMSPEQLANDDVRAEVAALAPSLVAVDEAHCVSSWGHDFRPDYLRLGELIADLGQPRIIALTATAAPPVREDIVRRLRMHDPLSVVSGLTRANIHLAVRRVVTERDQRQAVLEAAISTTGPGIIYAGTRQGAEELTEELSQAGLRAATYHAGLTGREREAAYQAFMAGGLDVMTATSAFGMGVDKPDVRYVLHAQAPESPDNYYQEVGRAGRDGQPAVGILFFRPEDLSQSRFFNASLPDPLDVAAVVTALDGRDPEAGDRSRLTEQTGFGARKLGRILNLLQEVRPDVTSTEGPVLAVMKRADAERSMQESRIDMMRRYAETRSCRRQFLLGYFGEQGSPPCGDCDNCRAGVTQEPDLEPGTAAPFAAEDKVRHEQFGDGVVMGLDGDQLTVLFADVGYRTLHLPTLIRESLLEPI